jgi:hypothetical protein
LAIPESNSVAIRSPVTRMPAAPASRPAHTPLGLNDVHEPALNLT